MYKKILVPLDGSELAKKAEASIDHPWFVPGAPPVIIAVGRLTEQKDFPTLLQAFAQVRAQRQARLLLLGEGEMRRELEAIPNLFLRQGEVIRILTEDDRVVGVELMGNASLIRGNNG